MSDLVLILLSLLIGAAVLGLSLALAEDPPRWFAVAWNAVAHPLHLPRYAKGGTARTSGLVAVTSCDLGQHPREDVENPFRSHQVIDEWDRYCHRCKTHFKESPVADCLRCERPMTADTAYACSTCAGHLAADLGRTADLLPELDVTITRQAVTGGGSGRPSGEVRLAFDLNASQAADAITNTITTWARLVSEERGIAIQPPTPEHVRTFAGPVCRERAYFGHCEHGVCRDATPPPREPGDPLVEAVQFLGAQVEWIRHQRFADEALDELGYACWLLRSTVDRSPDRVYLGQCWATTGDGSECPEDVYAAPGASYTACRMCGSTWDVRERRAWLLRAARDTLATATQLAYALSWFTGRRLAPATVRSWALRGRILAKGIDRAGDPTYRVGDGEELMMAQVKPKIATLVDAGALAVQRLPARAEVCPAPASSPVRASQQDRAFACPGVRACARPDTARSRHRDPGGHPRRRDVLPRDRRQAWPRTLDRSQDREGERLDLRTCPDRKRHSGAHERHGRTPRGAGRAAARRRLPAPTARLAALPGRRQHQ